MTGREIRWYFDRILHLPLRDVPQCILSEEKMPIRLCYMGNTFLNNSSYQGRLKESTQLGAELLGDSTVDADAEIIAMVIDCLKKQD